MPPASDQPAVIDLEWLGGPRRIGAWRTGEVIVDCGPATTADTLIRALGERRPRALLLTHIHFDHAGAAGDLVARWPDLEVVVHERGARHLASPERLEASARRVFGDVFDERFGALTPIPQENLTVVTGGELVHGLRVLYTPGHASHHVAYLDEATGRAFPGDVTGMRLREGGPLLPPTPPPDIDVEAWLASIETLRERGPVWLGLPHFGAVHDASAHIDAVAEELRAHADAAERLDEDGYVRWAREALGEDVTEYDTVAPLRQNHVGLARWLRLREEQLSSG